MSHVPIEAHRSGLVGVSPEQALPGLTGAFDEAAMRGHLQAALFAGDRPTWTVESCTPTRPLYLPGDCCVLRYRFEARNGTDGRVVEPIVMGRVFPDASTCAAYMTGKLAPLAARMRDRPEMAPFRAMAARIDALNMVVHVWPVDGELPTLVDATDRRRMIDVLQDTVPEALGQSFEVEDCRIELVTYRRRQRCVLRYTINGGAEADGTRPLVVYGKVSAAGDAELKGRMINALRDSVLERAADHRFAVPRALGASPDLQLVLLEALPGEARIGPALKARLRGKPAPDGPALEEMVATCGDIAATLHTSAVTLGRPRTFDNELAGLLPEVEMLRQFAPSLAARARSWLERIAALAAPSEPSKLSLSHGDLKHEQILFDGVGSGLVDFDAICQAEPALDLGKFVAHLRTEAGRHSRGSGSSRLSDDLAERFLVAYFHAAGSNQEAESRLRLRTMLYEAIALLRFAVRSQLDFDEPRVEVTTGLLEQRLTTLATEQRTRRWGT